MDINAKDYYAKQLRAWLLELGLPVSGTKDVMAMRLSQVPVEERGVCPELCDEPDNEEDDEDYGSVDGDNGLSHNKNADNVGDGSAVGINVNQDTAHADNAAPTNSVSEQTNTEQGEGSNAFNDMQLLRRELELITREKNLLEREKQLLAQGVSNENGAGSGQLMNLSLLKEFMADFDGTGNVKLWTEQLISLGQEYKVNEPMLRALFVTKIKGKAQKWLYGMPDFATRSLTLLIEELTEVFKPKADKLTMRKNFEKRKWQVGESFVDYCNEKSILAQNIQMHEDELVEYLIEGIPDPQLRIQANMLCLDTKKSLLKAYAKVELTPSNVPKHVTVPGGPTKSRCFNCNSVGHWAQECKKPKREPGSCYGCGSLQHLIAQCPQRKKTVMTVNEENINEMPSGFGEPC